MEVVIPQSRLFGRRFRSQNGEHQKEALTPLNRPKWRLSPLLAAAFLQRPRLPPLTVIAIGFVSRRLLTAKTYRRLIEYIVTAMKNDVRHTVQPGAISLLPVCRIS